jgi:hypothetical protein
MTPIELHFLREKLSNSRCYLEFGAGYSTLIASDHPSIRVISFETDVNYCEFIQKKLVEKGDSHKVEIVHVDIGPTGEWGWPEVNPEESRFPNYLWAPISRIKSDDFNPDLILIDGRFRVATFLACLIEFPGVKIVFDDYLDREFYHIVEEILKPKSVVGRIAFFKSPNRLSRKKILHSLEIIRKYTLEPS